MSSRTSHDARLTERAIRDDGEATGRRSELVQSSEFRVWSWAFGRLTERREATGRRYQCGVRNGIR